jgi:YD repeat-containing protein
MEKKQITRQFQYDPLNRLLSISVKDDYSQVYTYDSAGNRISVTSAGTPMPVIPVTGMVPAEPGVQKTGLPYIHAEQQLCRKCGTPIISGKKFCSGCGAPVSTTVPASSGSPAAPLQTLPVCPGCGKPNNPGAVFCYYCGHHL